MVTFPRSHWALSARGESTLTGGLLFVLTRWRATVFVSLLHIAGLFSGHVSGIEVVLAFRILAGLFLSRALVVGHPSFLCQEVMMSTGLRSPSSVVALQQPVLICRATIWTNPLVAYWALVFQVDVASVLR